MIAEVLVKHIESDLVDQYWKSQGQDSSIFPPRG